MKRVVVGLAGYLAVITTTHYIGQEYQIVLSSGDPDRVMISIVDAEGNPLEPSVQQGLLTLLQGNIT